MQWAGSSTAWDLSSETFHSVFTSAYAKGLLEIYYIEFAQTVKQAHSPHKLNNLQVCTEM